MRWPLVALTGLALAALASGAQAGCGPDAQGVSRTLTLPRVAGAYGAAQHAPLALAPGEVVLTFDDGPRPETTPAVLKALADQCLRATFFMVGDALTQNPDLARQVAAAGHSTGLHSLSHRNQGELAPAAQLEDLAANQAAYVQVFGTPAPAYRFPFLAETPTLLKALSDQNLTVMSIDLAITDWLPDDTTPILVGRLVEQLKAKGGGIILMHDANGPTARAMPALLAAIREGGYRVVALNWAP